MKNQKSSSKNSFYYLILVTIVAVVAIVSLFRLGTSPLLKLVDSNSALIDVTGNDVLQKPINTLCIDPDKTYFPDLSVSDQFNFNSLTISTSVKGKYNKETAKAGKNPFKDECVSTDQTKVNEKYCKDAENIGSKIVSCAEGSFCNSGRCLQNFAGCVEKKKDFAKISGIMLEYNSVTADKNPFIKKLIIKTDMREKGSTSCKSSSVISYIGCTKEGMLDYSVGTCQYGCGNNGFNIGKCYDCAEKPVITLGICEGSNSLTKAKNPCTGEEKVINIKNCRDNYGLPTQCSTKKFNAAAYSSDKAIDNEVAVNCEALCSENEEKTVCYIQESKTAAGIISSIQKFFTQKCQKHRYANDVFIWSNSGDITASGGLTACPGDTKCVIKNEISKTYVTYKYGLCE